MEIKEAGQCPQVEIMSLKDQVGRLQQQNETLRGNMVAVLKSGEDTRRLLLECERLLRQEIIVCPT
jgi:hypothetical protein